MKNIEESSLYLKILEFFGLQYFSLSSFTLSLNLKFPSIKYTIYFLFRNILFIMIDGSSWFHFYAQFQNESLNENILGFVFKIFVIFLSIIKYFIAFFEAFFKTNSNQKFLFIFSELEIFLKVKFNKQFNFYKLKKVLVHRLILIVIVLVIYTLIFGIKIEIMLIKIWTDFFTNFLILYKSCFYVDLIYMSLNNLLTVLNEFPKYYQNEKLILIKIFEIKKIYICIIEMTDELNKFLSLTLTLYLVNNFMWVLTDCYDIFRKYLIGIQIDKLICKYYFHGLLFTIL